MQTNVIAMGVFERYFFNPKIQVVIIILRITDLEPIASTKTLIIKTMIPVLIKKLLVEKSLLKKHAK